jgi:lysophospholipase L1-like esterase
MPGVLKGRLGRLLLLLAGLAVGLVSVEGVFRATGYGAPVTQEDLVLEWVPETPFRIHPDPTVQIHLKSNFVGYQRYRQRGGDTVVRKVPVSTTVQGQRSTGRNPQAGDRRILVVGDSVTFGHGVGDLETFSAQLEGRLEGVAVLNGGVPTWNLVQEIAWIESEARALEPDMILLGFCENDFMPAHYVDSADPMPRLVQPAPDWTRKERGLRARYYSLNKLLRVIERRALAKQIYGEDQSLLRGLASHHNLYRKGFKQLAGLCEKWGIPCRVIILPGFRIDGPDLHEVLEGVAQDAEMAGLPAIRLQDVLSDMHPAERKVLPADPHPSALAHARIATFIEGELADQLEAWRSGRASSGAR